MSILRLFFWGGGFLFEYISCLSIISFNNFNLFSIQISNSNLDTPGSFLIFSRSPTILFQNQHFHSQWCDISAANHIRHPSKRREGESEPPPW
jgi:hypothetical protein